MKDPKIRQAIAAEAARLISQRKEADFHTARRKAARWFSRGRVAAENLPNFNEIQQELFALNGLFSSERQVASSQEVRAVAQELLELLDDFHPRAVLDAVTGPVSNGLEIEILLGRGEPAELAAILLDAGHRAHLRPDGALAFFHHYACSIWPPERAVLHKGRADALQLTELKDLLELPEKRSRASSLNIKPTLDSGAFSSGAVSAEDIGVGSPDKGEDERHFDESDELHDSTGNDSTDDDSAGDDFPEDGYHPDFFPTLHLLLNSLEKIRLDPDSHPEGDLLYHSLQTYELMLQQRPYDEELLLAALIHDIGYGLDRRRPIEAAWNAIGPLVSERTWFLIENRPEAQAYVTSGRIRGALRKSENFDDLILLAQCDLKARVRGVQVSTVEEALDYIEGLGTAWDDVTPDGQE